MKVVKMCMCVHIVGEYICIWLTWVYFGRKEKKDKR